jgi:hypothetical protein
LNDIEVEGESVPQFSTRDCQYFPFGKSHNKVEMRRKKLDSLLSAISLINWSVNCEALNALHLKV